MKPIFIFITVCLSSIFSPLEEVRKAYAEASSSKENAELFLKNVAKITANIPAAEGYKAVSDILQAKFATDKNKRKELLIKGTTALDDAIQKHPTDYELRLIRLSVQEHTPKALKYQANIEEDAKFLLENYTTQKTDLQKMASEYAKKSKKINLLIYGK
ncbi:MAG: hypothetical protein Q4G08_06960 [Capnocytophaga sp.]|nr:hypothetical protein [Capnocytophaga sp.]